MLFMRKRHTDRARILRQQATSAEQKLWAELRKQAPFTNLKFRKQQPIDHFIVDFYCAEHRCVIEIDGASHDARQDRDAIRDKYLQQNNIVVMRFTEAETLRDPIAVIETVYMKLGIPLTSKTKT
jgi:very-short-patch-repair endonuclease